MCSIFWRFYFILFTIYFIFDFILQFILQFIITIITERFEDFDMSSLTFIYKHFTYT